MKDIAIIGAGISGLTTANILKDHANVKVFDKSRGVGGRMSTRRAEPYFFDHGAQYFKARTDEFNNFIKPMINQEVIKVWNARYIEVKDKEIVQRSNWNDQDPHYVGVPGMNAIAKYLSINLNVELGIRVNSINKKNGKWLLEDDNGNNIGEYDWVLSTIPPEQASEILPNSFEFKKELSKVEMKGCFAVMLGFENEINLDFDAAQVNDEDISWIAVNSSKPGRGNGFSILIHADNDWSDKNIEKDQDEVMKYLCNLGSEIVGQDLNKANHKAIHRWRYANIEKQSGNSHFLDKDNNIALCGDWFIEGRVESAFLSGFEVGNNILDILNSEK